MGDTKGRRPGGLDPSPSPRLLVDQWMLIPHGQGQPPGAVTWATIQPASSLGTCVCAPPPVTREAETPTSHTADPRGGRPSSLLHFRCSCFLRMS